MNKLYALPKRWEKPAAPHPKKQAFEQYVKNRQVQVDDIENSPVNRLWLLQKG